MNDKKRCDVCGWPLAERAQDGCIEGNCSQRPIPTCHICGKYKGQPPDRCNGHYEVTPSAPSDPPPSEDDRARAERIFEKLNISFAYGREKALSALAAEFAAIRAKAIGEARV